MESIIGYALAGYLIVAVGYTAFTDKTLKETLKWPLDLYNKVKS